MKVCWCDDDGGGFVGRKADFGCDSPACSAKASFERASACRRELLLLQAHTVPDKQHNTRSTEHLCIMITYLEMLLIYTIV
jgi:hypothetical protein